MFASLSDRLSATFKGLRGKGRLSESDINDTIREIRIALLEADVALPAVRVFTDRVRERAVGAEVSGALNPAQQVVKIVHEELIELLGGQTRRLQFAKNPPTVILLAGLQGSGKTTLAGKLAVHLKEQGHTPMLVAADLQRPNAVDQLSVVAERAGAPVFAPQPGNTGANPEATWGDPVEVAREGVEIARLTQHDVVIVDTAGRLAIDTALMEQLRQVRDAVQPDEMLLVVDAMIGQDAVATAKAFHEGVGFDGVVLTKLDGDARGGAALSVVTVTGVPIMFGSTGEKLTDFELFHPDRMASRILDMGDVLTLIEQAEKAFDSKEAEKMAGKVHGRRGLHPRRLPVPDAGPAQDGQPRQAARDAARDGRDPRPDRQPRREGDRPRPGDHPVDDPGRARGRQAAQRLPPGPYRPRRGRAGQRGQRPGRALRRGAEDDAPDALRDGDARHAGDARHGRLEEGQGPRPAAAGQEEVAQRQPREARDRGVGPGGRPAGLPGGLEGFDPASFDPSMLDPEAMKKMGDLPPAFKDLLK